MLAADTEGLKHALASGQLTVTDPSTGYHRSMYADCPRDGHTAAVWRVVRDSNNAITELTMHCPICGHAFTAPAESLYLR